MSYKMYWGKNAQGQAIRSRDGKKWYVMAGADVSKVKTCALLPWAYPGKYEGKTIKEIAADDAEYLQWIMEMIAPESEQMECLRLLLK